MAKKKDVRMPIGLVCKECGSRNYITEKNRIETKQKLTFRKYCSTCRGTRDHKETQKLK